jgi:hypothetical protein
MIPSEHLGYHDAHLDSTVDSSRRWGALGCVVAGKGMFSGFWVSKTQRTKEDLIVLE